MRPTSPVRSREVRAGRPAAPRLLSLAAGAALIALAGCSGEVTVRGNMPDPEVVETIQPGSTTRQGVAEMLGSPSTVSNFEDKSWYYIGQKQTQVAFLEPEILERSVLVVTFNDAGTVQEAKQYTLEDGRIIDPVTRTTPTEGRELTIVQQIFGNLGRFPTSQQQ